MAELAPLVAQIRHCWPDTKILVRGDSGFCREQIMAWCERQGVDYVLGLARNARLQKRIDKALRKSRRRCATTVTASPAWSLWPAGRYLGETRSGSVHEAQQLVHDQRQDAEHQVAQHLAVPAHVYLTGAEFVLQPTVDALDCRPLPVAHTLGVHLAKGSGDKLNNHTRKGL